MRGCSELSSLHFRAEQRFVDLSRLNKDLFHGVPSPLTSIPCLPQEWAVQALVCA